MKHGEAHKTSEYHIWRAMKARCANPRHKCYADYGGRGITVCLRWRESYSAFLGDMGRRPSRRHSLERRNNGRGYSSRNCYWATQEQQQNNRRSNVMLTCRNATLSVAQWARRLGMSRQAIHQRLGRGATIEGIVNATSDDS